MRIMSLKLILWHIQIFTARLMHLGEREREGDMERERERAREMGGEREIVTLHHFFYQSINASIICHLAN